MKRISARNALFIAVGFIILMWAIKIIKNTIYIDKILELSESIYLFIFIAVIIGAFYVLAVTLLLRLSQEKYRNIGFDRQNILRQLRFGFLFGALIFVIETFLLSPILDALLPKTVAQGIDMSRLFKDIYFLPVWILIVVFKGGFSEEIWRTFTLTRFEKLSGKSGLIIALILSSVVFGFGHLYQGISGLISNMILGLCYALVYLRKRSAFEAVSAHSTFDIISIMLGYIIYYGK